MFTQTISLKEAAEWYAYQHKKIFALSPNSKIPVKGSSGFKNATNDVQSVKWMWNNTPSANIGFPCGYTNDVFVLDVDNKNGINGSASLQQLEQEHGQLPTTLRALTPSGGVHYFFRFPKDFEVRNDQNAKIGKGLDIRGEGGYVLVAPSVIDGKYYEWVDPNAPVVDAPEWLLNCIKKAIVNKNKVTVTTNHSHKGFTFPEEVVVQGERNNTCFSKACWLRGNGHSFEDMVSIMNQFDQLNCNPPLGEKEIYNICKSAAKYEPNPTDLNPVMFKQTDKGNAEWFAVQNINRLLYDCKQQRWLVWGGNWWMEDKTGVVFNRVVDAARERQKAIVSLANNPEFQKVYHKWVVGSENLSRVKSCIELAQYEEGLCDTGESWDADPWLLGVQNGIVELKTRELRAGNPADRISAHAAVSFDKNASCPRWLKFLNEIFPNKPEMISYIQRAMGYSLTGSNREQIMFFCYGSGMNGKNVLIDVMRALMGDYGASVDPNAFDSHQQTAISNDVAELVGKRLVTTSETKMSTTVNEQKIKKLVHGDEYSCRKLHQNLFSFTPILKLWFAVNELPRVTDPTNGLWRSTQVIPFTVQFVKADEPNPDELPVADLQLKDYLIANELPGILNWALNGCFEYQQRGLKPPAEVLEAVNAYKEDQDVLAEFITTRCELDKDAKEHGSTMYKNYVEWADNIGLKEYEKLNNKMFIARMRTKFARKKLDGYHYFYGVRLKYGSND